MAYEGFPKAFTSEELSSLRNYYVNKLTKCRSDGLIAKVTNESIKTIDAEIVRRQHLTSERREK